MTKKLAFLLLIPLLAGSLYAQDQSQEPTSGSTQNGAGTMDCSDPLMASSSLCSGQYGGYGGGYSGAGYPRTSMGLPGTMGAGQQMQGSTYYDNEPYGRQNGSYQFRRPLPPQPLTDFQKFVASTTGQVLPIYGASLFREVPSTFAPLDLSPVPPDHIIGPGDDLRIRVWGQVNFRADLLVDRSGDIYLPQVGEVHVAGMPFSELDGHLRAAIGRVYRNFDLTADIGQIRAIQVYLAGEAISPGVYTVSSLSTLVDALFASGGPSTSGSLRDIELRRNGKVVTDFDLYSLLIHGDKSKDVPLQSGDVIFIPAAGPEIALTGSVRKPAIYELRKGETVAEAIADAGGASATAAETRVSIERIDDHRDRFAMEVKYDKEGLSTELADGDLVRIYSVIPGYQKTVTLRGNIANPGRFAWHPGMKVSDLIPDRDSLITRNYWWKRAQLGLPEPEFEPLRYFPNLLQPSTPMELNRRRLLGQPPLLRPEANQKNNTNGTSTSSAQPSSQSSSTQSTADQYPTDQYSIDQSYAALDYGQMGTLPDQTSTTAAAPDQTNSQQPAGQAPAQQSAANSTLAAEQTNPAERAAVTTQVGPIAPDIDWNYAVIERLDRSTLKTSLIPFDLGRLVLHHDESQDLALEPGDVLTIFSQADIRVPLEQQTKFVRLEGEFVHAGVYTVRPGETLRDLVQRAGGFSSDAYLYGSEFTRESTRVVQQRRLDEYLQSLQLQIQRGNLAIESSPVTSAQDLASGSAAQSSEQALLSELRQLRATGRIVLEFRPGSHGLDVVPNIALENGDHFVVPSMPASVNVVGSVYDQNSFLYESTRRAGTYLRLAGGPNRDADQKHIFIIRADGSVVSREAESGIWGNEFDSLHVNPGDTIVVPEKTFKPSALRGFLEWSQFFSSFAFGAAALSVILP